MKLPVRYQLSTIKHGVRILVAFALIGSPLLPAQRLNTIHAFAGKPRDGGGPNALFSDSSGDLYGTTAYGGRTGNGTIFRLDTSGHESILYNFKGQPDGSDPQALVRDAAGNLYGVDRVGGKFNAGTVFRLAAAGKESSIYTFTGQTDGLNPSSLIQGPTHELIGTTVWGGAAGLGSVFIVTPSGKETVLYSFQGGSDGIYPFSSVVRDPDGNLYGTTAYGGTGNGAACNPRFGCGTAYKISKDGTETILYNFGSTSNDGVVPFAGLVRDENGNLFGTTSSGGAGQICGEIYACGTVFRLSPPKSKNGKWTETILYSFTGGSDGGDPGNILRDSSGNINGTTATGGTHGFGTLFRLGQDGKKIVLYNFTGIHDGGVPLGALVQNSAGEFYGATGIGGNPDCNQQLSIADPTAKGCGTVFQFMP